MDRKPPPDVTPRHLDWRDEIEVAVRDGYACRRCEVVVVDEIERSFVRIDPDAGDDLENIALVCAACMNAHRVHPEPVLLCADRTPTLT